MEPHNYSSLQILWQHICGTITISPTPTTAVTLTTTTPILTATSPATATTITISATNHTFAIATIYRHCYFFAYVMFDLFSVTQTVCELTQSVNCL